MRRLQADRPETHPTLRVLLRIYSFLASIEFGIVLLILFCLILGVTTFIANRYNESIAQFGVYGTNWFACLCGLLGLNVLLAMLIRYPWHRRQVGFLMVHLGILTMLAGSMATWRSGIDANLSVVEGGSSSVAVSNDEYVFWLELPGAGQSAPIVASHPFHPGPFSWRAYQQELAFLPWRPAAWENGKIRWNFPSPKAEETNEKTGEGTNSGTSPQPSEVAKMEEEEPYAVTLFDEILTIRGKEMPVRLEALDYFAASRELTLPYLKLRAEAATVELSPHPAQPGMTQQRTVTLANDEEIIVSFTPGLSHEQIEGLEEALPTSGKKRMNFTFADQVREVLAEECVEGFSFKLLGAENQEATITFIPQEGKAPEGHRHPSYKFNAVVKDNEETPQNATLELNLGGDPLAQDTPQNALGVSGSVVYWQPRVNFFADDEKGELWCQLVHYDLEKGEYVTSLSKLENKYMPLKANAIIDSTIDPSALVGWQLGELMPLFEGTSFQTSLTLQAYIPSDKTRRGIVRVPFEEKRMGMDPPQVQVRLTIGEEGKEESVTGWMQLNFADLLGSSENLSLDEKALLTNIPLLKLHDSQGNLLAKLYFGYRTVPLGFRVKLEKFVRRLDPGSSKTAEYVSKVTIYPRKQAGAKEEPKPLIENVEIRVNEPLDVTDPKTGVTYRLYQSTYEEPPSISSSRSPRDELYRRPFKTGLSVNYDPGRFWKYLASLLICVGIALAIFRR